MVSRVEMIKLHQCFHGALLCEVGSSRSATYIKYKKYEPKWMQFQLKQNILLKQMRMWIVGVPNTVNKSKDSLLGYTIKLFINSLIITEQESFVFHYFYVLAWAGHPVFVFVSSDYFLCLSAILMITLKMQNIQSIDDNTPTKRGLFVHSYVEYWYTGTEREIPWSDRPWVICPCFQETPPEDRYWRRGHCLPCEGMCNTQHKCFNLYMYKS